MLADPHLHSQQVGGGSKFLLQQNGNPHGVPVSGVALDRSSVCNCCNYAGFLCVRTQLVYRDVKTTCRFSGAQLLQKAANCTKSEAVQS